MIRGIGADIVSERHLESLRGRYDDPFFQKTFTEREREAAMLRKDPVMYFTERFAAKEAVFKSMRISPDSMRLDEIETLNDDKGCPCVNLCGKMKEMMDVAGGARVFVSITSDNGFAAAFAVCEIDG